MALPLVLFLWAGEEGIDFGRHWDEGHRVVDYSKAARSQTFLPTAYNYPSMTFAVGMVAFGPKFAETMSEDRESPEFKKGITEYIGSDEFIFRVRRHFLVLSAASLLWIFAALIAWGRHPLEALVASMLLGCSFELNYHARWIAPDAITMQFVAFTILALVAAHKNPKELRWLVISAIGLGLATTTKYLAAILAIPICLLLVIRGAPFRTYLSLAGISLLTFFVVSPGVLIQPTRFLEDVLYEQEHYRFGHFGFTVEAGFDHLMRSLGYLLFHAPSRELWISLLFTALGALGLVSLFRESPRFAVVLLSIPLIYLTFISFQRVMFVRNLLFLMPFGAILSARGAAVLWQRHARPLPRAALAITVAAGLGVNAAAMVGAGQSVRDYTPVVQLQGVHDYLSQHSEQSFQLSPTVFSRLKKYGHSIPKNCSKQVDTGAEFLVCVQSELLEQGYWPSNDPNLFVRAFGPPSANYDYYSTWPRDVVAVLEIEKAREIASIHPPETIEGIFQNLDVKDVGELPDGQRASPHSKFKPGHRKGKKPSSKETSEETDEP